MNQLLEVIKSTQLDESKANVLLENFSNYFEIASEWQKKANELVVNDVSNVAEMKLAREGRLFLRDKRTMIEKTRKSLKENSLKEGRAIDEVAKVLTQLIVPIEEDLEQKEKFKERYEKLIKDELRLKRFNQIKDFEYFLPTNIDLAELTDLAFDTILRGAKAQHEEKLEKERLELEEREKAIIRKELHDKRVSELREYWSFLDEDIKIMNFGVMTDKYYNALLSDLTARKKDKEIELQKIREENERARLEHERIAKELMQERIKAEKERKLAEQERERLTAELQRKEAEEREKIRLQQLEEEKARKEAKKLAKAPIKKQLKLWVDSFELPNPPQDEVAVEIMLKFNSFKSWAITQIENL